MHSRARTIIISAVILPLVLLDWNFFTCVANDTISFSDSLPDNGERKTLISARKIFELGFFTPLGGGRYVGIWYYQSPQTFVWVANRDHPLQDLSGVLAIGGDGNLKLLDGHGKPYFFSNLERSSAINRTLKLLDSGNLVMIDGQLGTYLWQSFALPTDTFLLGMLMDDKLKLTSWKSPGDPGTGNYMFQQDKEGNLYIIRSGTVLYGKLDNETEIEMPAYLSILLSNLSYSVWHQSDPRTFFQNTRLFMNSSGEIQFYNWSYQSGWSLLWTAPTCSDNNGCGNFGICSNKNGETTCKCLPGFEPVSHDNWKLGESSSGCARKSACNTNKTEADTFLDLKLMETGNKYSISEEAKDEKECRDKCLSSCECRAFAIGVNGRIGSNNARGRCLIWKTDLSDLRKDDVMYSSGHHYLSISIRVTASDIKSTSRDCDNCGQNILPYPLSNRPNCGDPSYNNFFCYKSIGQLRFWTLNGSYEVISIDKDKSRFVIQAYGTGNDICGANSVDGVELLNQSMPFNVTKWCYSNSIYGESDKIEIGWKPPLEPLCYSSNDCLDWPHSTCKATADGRRRCLCNSNYFWDGLSLNCTTVRAAVPLRKQSESGKHEKKLIVSIIVIAVVLLSVSISCIIFRSGILVKRNVPKLDDGETRLHDTVVEDNKVIDVPFFSLESIIAATNHFSDENKLGQGGFGPVYKGVFNGENEVAVKRLSSHSGQGTDEFQNEVVLIAKLQHRNLVRLLGYCVRGGEKLLLYEFMRNKSLDTFLFDQGHCMLLDWKKRFDIIMGIARGLLYLHQDSRLRVIHRDLKTSNILLDEDLNPKISDFGLARIVEGKETEANTKKVVGTYGYMSPEYAFEGLFSIKSDVYSFGVILLEIISGKKNRGYYEESLSLLGYAWKLWQERRPLEFIDKKLWESCNSSINEVLKCINIGLLCVEEDPVDRPTTGNVLTMLSSETATLPHPNQPAFVSRKRPPKRPNSSSCKPGSINELTLSVEKGR